MKLSGDLLEIRFSDLSFDICIFLCDDTAVFCDLLLTTWNYFSLYSVEACCAFGAQIKLLSMQN